MYIIYIYILVYIPAEMFSQHSTALTTEIVNNGGYVAEHNFLRSRQQAR